MTPGQWFLTSDSLAVAPCQWIPVSDSWSVTPGQWLLVGDLWSVTSGPWLLVSDYHLLGLLAFVIRHIVDLMTILGHRNLFTSAYIFSNWKINFRCLYSIIKYSKFLTREILMNVCSCAIKVSWMQDGIILVYTGSNFRELMKKCFHSLSMLLYSWHAF